MLLKMYAMTVKKVVRLYLIKIQSFLFFNYAFSGDNFLKFSIWFFNN